MNCMATGIWPWLPTTGAKGPWVVPSPKMRPRACQVTTPTSPCRTRRADVVGRGVQLGGRLLQEGEAFADHLIGDVRVVVVVVEDEGVLFLQREGGDGG